VNVQGTRNALKASLDQGISRFIYISTSAVYDLNKMPITEKSPIKPLGSYGKAKYKAELAVNEWAKKGLHCVIIRPRTIVDEHRAGIFQILYDWVHDGRTIYIVGDGSNLFQLISAADLCEACCAAAKSEKTSGEIINIGNERFGTYRELIADLIDHAGSGSKIKHINPTFAKLGLRLLDTLRLSPLAEWHYQTIDKPFYFDIRKAKGLLHWAPKDSNRDIITRSYNWYIANRRIIDQKSGTTHRTSPKQKLLSLLKKIS